MGARRRLGTIGAKVPGDRDRHVGADRSSDRSPSRPANAERFPADRLTPEERQAERILLVCVLMSRYFNIGIAAASAMADRARPNRFRAAVYLSAAALESAWLTSRTWRRGSFTDRATVWADTTFAVALLGTRRVFARRSAATADDVDNLDWLFQYSLTATAAAAIGQGPGAEGALATGALALANHSGSSITGKGEWIAYPGTLLAVGFMGREMRRSARELGASRQIALELTREQATARERLRQHRLLHDSALQTLEAAATHWGELGDAIKARSAVEARELRAAQIGEVEDRFDLTTLLRGLIDQFDNLGLEVALETRHISTHGQPSPRVTAIVDAVNEALVNVRKHAGTTYASIETASEGNALLVVVTDSGSGFDPDEVRPRRVGGFGIQGSIHDRLDEVGATAQLLSRPGAGTRVIIRCDIPTGSRAESGARR